MMVESSTAPVASTSERLSAAVACITTESMRLPMVRLKVNSQSLTRMDAASTPTVTQENAASSGWMILSMLVLISSKPSSRMMKATTSDAMYSMRAWPKGWSSSAGLPASLNDSSEITDEPASERLLTASAAMDTEPDTVPTMNFPANSSALSTMPVRPVSCP